MRYAVKLNAGNDVNGNPRRITIIYDDIGRIDNMMHNPDRMPYRDDIITLDTIYITSKEYKERLRFCKNYKGW